MKLIFIFISGMLLSNYKKEGMIMHYVIIFFLTGGIVFFNGVFKWSVKLAKRLNKFTYYSLLITFYIACIILARSLKENTQSEFVTSTIFAIGIGVFASMIRYKSS